MIIIISFFLKNISKTAETDTVITTQPGSTYTKVTSVPMSTSSVMQTPVSTTIQTEGSTSPVTPGRTTPATTGTVITTSQTKTTNTPYTTVIETGDIFQLTLTSTAPYLQMICLSSVMLASASFNIHYFQRIAQCIQNES